MTDAVERTIEIEADPDDVWELLVDDDERAAWFGGPTTLDPVPGGAGIFTEPDGTRRQAVVEESEPGRRLSWTWWPESGDDGPSRVDIDLAPVEPSRPGAPTIGTRVTVVERPAAVLAAQATVRRSTATVDLAGLELQAMLRHRAPVPTA